MRKRHIHLIVNFILIFLIVFSLCGCGKSETKNETGFSVYYVDKSGTKLVSEEYGYEEENASKQVLLLIEKLCDNGKEKENLSAIPQDVTVNGVNLKDGIAVVDFNDKYNDMVSQRELLCRAAVVLTLSQVPSVEYVAFTINDEPCKNVDGTYLDSMKASDFVADLGGGNNIFAKADFTLYFATEDGSKLKEYKLADAKYGEKSKEQFIVEQLIKGPGEKGYLATLSPNLKLLSVVTANNICYVDFGDNFATEQSKVPNDLVIYSIVNSLLELNDIHKVQISISGDSALKYHDDISLSEPFIRNLDIVENNE